MEFKKFHYDIKLAQKRKKSLKKMSYANNELRLIINKWNLQKFLKLRNMYSQNFRENKMTNLL